MIHRPQLTIGISQHLIVLLCCFNYITLYLYIFLWRWTRASVWSLRSGTRTGVTMTFWYVAQRTRSRGHTHSPVREGHKSLRPSTLWPVTVIWLERDVTVTIHFDSEKCILGPYFWQTLLAFLWNPTEITFSHPLCIQRNQPVFLFLNVC